MPRRTRARNVRGSANDSTRFRRSRHTIKPMSVCLVWPDERDDAATARGTSGTGPDGASAPTSRPTIREEGQ